MSPTRITPSTPAVSPKSFESWLRRRMSPAAEPGEAVSRLRLIRTSGRELEAWLNSATTSFAAIDRERDPDVAAALKHGFDVVRNDPIGDSKRLDLGDAVFTVRMGHAPGGRGKARLGVCLHIGQTLFFYILSSARANNLAGPSADREGNAVTEIVSTAIREMHAFGTRLDPAFRPELHAREHGRIIRSMHHGMALKRTLELCSAIVFVPHRIDLRDAAAAQSFTFGTMIEDSAVEAIIRGMNRPEILIQANGGWYEGIGNIPFTHGPARTVETDPRTGRTVESVNIHRLAVTEDVDSAGATLRALVDKILEPGPGSRPNKPRTDWEAVGNLAAELGLPSRRPADLKHGVLLRDKPSAARAAAMRSLFAERWVSGWRAGSFTKLVRVKVPVDLELGEDVPIIERDGKTWYRCTIQMPLPEGGWGITDDEWDEVLRRRHPQRNADGGSALPEPRQFTTDRLPFTGLAAWDDDAAQRQVRLFAENGRYRLRCRPLSHAYPDGVAQGWQQPKSYPSLATMRAEILHTAVGAAMQEALEGLGDQASVPVRLTTIPEHTQGRAVYDLARQVEEAERALQDAVEQVEGAEDTRNAALGRAKRTGSEQDKAELQRAERAVTRAAARELEASSRLTHLHAQQATTAVDAHPRPVTAHVESATAEFVAVALQKCAGKAPAWLKQACHHFLDNWHFTVTKKPGARAKVDWRCDLILEDPETGQGIAVPMAGQVDSSAQRRTSGAPATAEDWAWAFFYAGRSLEDIALEAGLGPTIKKNSHVYKELLAWLQDTVTEQDLRTAALHCPVPATRRVLWSAVTGDEGALDALDPGFVEHIRRTYQGKVIVNSWTWCRGSHDLARRVADLLQQQGGGSPIHHIIEKLIEQEVPVDHEQLLRLSRGATSQKRSAGNTALPFFEKNFWRGTAVPPADRRLSLRACPHSDCPARQRGETPYCTVIIRVPETEDGYGVLCPWCRRCPVPAMSRIRFPADYLRPWSGRYGHNSKAGARQAKTFTFLTPGAPDPGPGLPLPDTGTLPRPATKPLRRGSTYVPADVVRSSPMGARRFLLDGSLTPSDLDRLRTFIEKNGGRSAHRMVGDVAALVCADPNADDDRVRTARVRCTAVLTPEQFLERAPQSWGK